ncbi:hypothetical protein WLH_04274 [Escherichia coli O25b:H4]|uniref:Uncharacterized protein n=1 Tax=Escherichia coli O25b:H4 TaxID=941280 RepID=A0A192CHZ6_ECO25|nr:hypothetical protein WLH_04274 [Escherichia coli O25b:H4]
MINSLKPGDNTIICKSDISNISICYQFILR